MVDQLCGQYDAICPAAAAPGGDMTAVFDAGQNPEASFARLAGTDLQVIGSVPVSDCSDLNALPASARAVIDREYFGGLTACDTRRETCGASRAPPWPRPAASPMSWPPPRPSLLAPPG